MYEINAATYEYAVHFVTIVIYRHIAKDMSSVMISYFITAASSPWKKAPGSFIFSLRNKENLPPFKAPLKDDKTGHAIYTSPSYGPTFGNDLEITDNATSNTNSYTKCNEYYQAPSAALNTSTILAGTHKFTPSEVEVFYLVKS